MAYDEALAARVMEATGRPLPGVVHPVGWVDRRARYAGRLPSR